MYLYTYFKLYEQCSYDMCFILSAFMENVLQLHVSYNPYSIFQNCFSLNCSTKKSTHTHTSYDKFSKANAENTLKVLSHTCKTNRRFHNCDFKAIVTNQKPAKKAISCGQTATWGLIGFHSEPVIIDMEYIFSTTSIIAILAVNCVVVVLDYEVTSVMHSSV